MKIRIKRKLNEGWAIKKGMGQRAGASSLSGPHFHVPGDAHKAVQSGQQLQGWTSIVSLSQKLI